MLQTFIQGKLKPFPDFECFEDKKKFPNNSVITDNISEN